MPEHLIAHWGYLAIVLGTFVEGEGVLLSAGALAHVGLLSLPLVVLAAASGSLIWGQFWFALGHAYGHGFLERRPKWRARSLLADRWVTRYGAWLIVAFRFIAGAAIVVPLLVGASRFARGRFLLLDALGATLWATVFACAGFGVGAGWQRVQGHALSLPEVVIIALAGVAIVFSITQVVRACLAQSGARPPSP